MVCSIHRPEYYKIYTSADGHDLRGMAEIIIAKHRNGAVGDVRLRFIGEFTRFQNPEDDTIAPPPGESGGGKRYGSRMNAASKGSNNGQGGGHDGYAPIDTPLGPPMPDGEVPF